MMAGCGSSSENAGTGSSGTEEVQGKLDVSAVTEYRYDLYIADDGTFEGVKALDYVTLPEDIDSISFKDAAVDIDQTTVEQAMDYIKQNYGDKIPYDGKAELGHGVLINYEGTVDGVIFQGGTASDVELVLGSGQYLSDFENGIVGHSAGDVFDINVLFPDGYGSSQDINGNEVVLSNKTAVFKITLKEIYEFGISATNIAVALDDLNMNAAEYGYPIDEEGLRELISDRIALSNRRSLVEDYLLSNSTVKEVPTVITDSIISYEGAYIQTGAQQYGYDNIDQFIQMYGYESFAQYINTVEESIIAEAENVLIRQAVAEHFGIKVGDAEKISTFGSLDAYDNEVLQMGEKLAVQEALYTAAVDQLINK